MVRRLDGLPFEDFPYRTNIAPWRPYYGAFGLRRRSATTSWTLSRRRMP